MKNTAIMHSSGWIVLGLALVLGALLLPCAGLAQVYEGEPQVYETYNDYAILTGHMYYQAADTNSPAEPIWTEGWMPGDDPDGDGLSNEAEFKGGYANGAATVNGLEGVYSYWRQDGKVYLGRGSNPLYFDQDGDGVSDEYETRLMHTNPNAKDTDGDGIYDSVEAYAGLSPCEDGYIYDYTIETKTVSYSVDRLVSGQIVKTDVSFEVQVATAKTAQEETGYEYDEGTGSYTEVSTGKKKMTQQHPDFDIDGDGITNKQELKKAIKAIKDYSGPGERTAADFHFPHDILNGCKWTSPLNCDSDGDWLLDPFENAWSKAGYNVVESEPDDSETHWGADPDADGLVTFREQCLHPLLAYGWNSVAYTKNMLRAKASWPYASSSYKSVYGEDAWKNGTIGWRFGKERILNGTPGYLKAAQYGKLGDMQRFYKKDKDGNWTLAGAEGDVFWGEPKGYWTTPKKHNSYPGPSDCDGDGLPDGWEVEHGLNPLSGSLGAADSNDSEDDDEPYAAAGFMTASVDPGAMFGDPDQDGLVNYEEYWGQDGHRIDFITGTGDETSPWIARGLNYPNQSPFDDYITQEGGVYWYIAREAYEGPYGFSYLMPGEAYSEILYPGFFLSAPMLALDPLSGTYSEVENDIWTYNAAIPSGEGTVAGIVKGKARNRIPTPGAPAPCMLNDMATLAETYGDGFLMANNTNLLADGEGAYQPFATAYGSLWYAEAEGAEDGRYTPYVDAVWYASVASDGVYQDLTMNGDLVLSDPEGILVAGTQGYPLFDNIPLMMPMPGYDTDSDGLPDSMEIQMDAGRDKPFTSPVQGLSPLKSRSARIVNTNGMQAAFTTDLFVFSRQFTVEAWVFLDGTDPAEGTFVRGGQIGGSKYAFDLGVAPLRTGGTVTSPVEVDTVPYFGFHTVAGKWYQVSATQPLPRGRWVHLAGTYDPDKNGLSLYIDGLLEQTRSVQEESFATWMLYQAHGVGALLTVGQGEDFPDRLWIDEVRIWGVERTSAQIAANYNHLITGYQLGKVDNKDWVGGLMAYYPFDDGGTAAADLRHRAMSSLHMYDFPAQDTVVNAPEHEYLYPDLSYAFPVEELGGAFVFDAGNVAPVTGGLDAQQGEYDSDGDGLPDSFELQNNMNPFSWYTARHQYMRYDKQWGAVADASILIQRHSLLEWSASADGGATWTNVTCPLITSTAGGVVTQECCPNTVIIQDVTSDSSTETETDEEGNVTTNTVNNVTTNWVIMSGDVRDTIGIGETWWTTTSGTTVAPVSNTGKMVSDADGDYDGDGLTNLQEYWARTNPNKKDTNENGIPDGEEDFDADGLPNAMEIDNGARPDLADTDDDGYDDLTEVANGTSPAYSTEPGQSLAVYFDGKPGSWLAIQDATKYSLTDWTIEAKVVPSGYTFLGDGQSACILRRGVEDTTNGMTVANYELRVVRDGKKLYPMARYVFKNSKGAGEVVELRGEEALPMAAVDAPYAADKVTHLAVSYFGAGKRLRLYVGGKKVAERAELNVSNARNGEGPTSTLRIGEGFRGWIDDVRVWSTERTPSAILDSATGAPEGVQTALVANFNFDDGGWGGVLASNTFASDRYNILYSVKSTTAPAAGAMRDGDTWIDGGSVWICDAGTAVKVGTVSALGPVFCEGAVSGGSAATGQFGWSYLNQCLYRYDGTQWVKWGKTPLWLADVRSLVKGKVQTLDQILEYDPTPGDEFLDDVNGVVYKYRATLPMDRENATGLPEDIGYVAEMQADPLMPGHRFYVQSQETIVEWDGTKLVTVAHAYDVDGLVVEVQSEGMAYKSDAKRKYFRKWGYVPSLEDKTVSRGWTSGWTSAAKSSGGAQLYRTAASSSGYTPVSGVDTDGDGLPDEWELRYGLDPADPGFGGTSGLVDVDGDGRYDYVYNEADFVNGPWGDPDNDGLNNRAEYLAGTDPMKFDTDNNGVGDYDSSRTTGGATFGSLYMDGDDIPDGWESLYPTACSPLRYDSNLDPDGDGWDNFSEYMAVRKTMSGSSYSTVTNADGSVSSNFVSGTGYYVPYCLPDDPAVYPLPEMDFHFKVDCLKSGTLRIYAYTDKAMNCPDAETAYVLDAPLRDGNALSITDWTEGGHIRQGANYFMAFIDENNDGQWNEGELLGFSENMPENISWDKATINIALSEKAHGYPRVSWAGTETASTNGTASDEIAFVFKQGNTVMFQQNRSGCSATRKYFHEYDFMAQSAITGPLYGNYSWSVTPKGASTPTATGTADLRDYPSTLPLPKIHNPFGTMFYAKTRLTMTLDRGITDLRVVVKDASGTAIYDKTNSAPYVDIDGRAEIDFPLLLGWGKLTNGVYSLGIKQINPILGKSSDAVSFTVALNPPISGAGAAMISGTVDYHGYAEGSARRIVVEAYGTAGFDQKPLARTLAKGDGTYQLMGLPIGDAYVRAFHDRNANGELDGGEAWTILKGAPDGLKQINWGVAVIRGRTPKGGVSLDPAVTPYATDYSAKNVNIKAIRDYSGNDMVLHDADSDADGLPDAWERFYASSLSVMNEYSDMDKDGLLDTAEYLAGTDPSKTDTDGDGLSDADEVQKYGTDPTQKDSDGDGLTDSEEIKQYGTDPLSADSDGDGLSDADEIKGASGYVTDPLAGDTDGDGMDDGDEIANGYNPTDPADGAADDDGDGLTNAQELTAGTDPKNPDTDGDGWMDGVDPAPLDPMDPNSSPVVFKSAPTTPNSEGNFEVEISVGAAPLNVEVQSATNLVNGPNWVTATNLTLPEVTESQTILVPAVGNGPIRMFRIRIMP